MNLDLHTERLLLRPLTEEDVDIVLEMRTSPVAMQFTGGVETPDDVRSKMHLYLARGGGGCLGGWCVVERETNEKLGTAILVPMPTELDTIDWEAVAGEEIPDAEIEIGYLLKPSAWGKGYATEAASRLLQFAFGTTPLDEIVACFDEDNTASRRVLEKAGMHYSGVGRAYTYDLPLFRITKQQWLSQQST